MKPNMSDSGFSPFISNSAYGLRPRKASRVPFSSGMHTKNSLFFAFRFVYVAFNACVGQLFRRAEEIQSDG
jgi:hypothetical protein